jgi:hypothetical protein
MRVTCIVRRYGQLESFPHSESLAEAVSFMTYTADDCQGIPVAIEVDGRRIEGAELDALIAAEREEQDRRWDEREAKRG